MARRMSMDEAVKAASKVLPSNPDHERYFDELLARLSAADRHALAREGLSTLGMRLQRHRVRNAGRRETTAGPTEQTSS